MSLADTSQKFQDWFTQQWVIIWGRKINPKDVPWLIGPFGNLNGIGEDFIKQLAEKEKLIIERDTKSNGLLSSIHELHLSEEELTSLSKKVIQFYESTANYKLEFAVKWNPFFKLFGILVNKLFSNRINQLYIPTKNIKDAESLKSEIITLADSISKEIKYTIWFRTIKATNQVIYSGVYSTCKLPSGKTCVKAAFPLPKGNATVIMTPTVEKNGALTLNSSGKKFGDAGFYFLLIDSRGNYWSQYVKSFRDKLTIGIENDALYAEQKLTLWYRQVLTLKYKIEEKSNLNKRARMNNLLPLKSILKNRNFFFLFFCAIMISSCNDNWVEVENEYFSFRKPNEMKHAEPVAMSDEKQISGIIAIDGIIVNFYIVNDPKWVGPCRDYSEITLNNSSTTEQIGGQSYRLVNVLEKNNTYFLDLCIEQKAIFRIEKLPQDKLEQFKKIFMSIRLK